MVGRSLNRQLPTAVDFLTGNGGIFLEIAGSGPSIVIVLFNCLSNVSLMENH
jgi:hypothetical protein